MKDLKFTPESSFEKHFEKLRYQPFLSSLEHYLETGKVNGNAAIAVREMYKEFLETTDRINSQLEMALILRDGNLTNKLMHERITKLTEALKQAREVIQRYYNYEPSEDLEQALETINKLI